jgi:hypothetical protein
MACTQSITYLSTSKANSQPIMPFNKGSPYISKRAKAKMEAEKEREEEDKRRQEEEAAKRELELARELEMSKKDPPLILNTKTGRQNGHNWYVTVAPNNRKY